LIVLADGEHQRLFGFKFDSCYNVPKQAEWQLPIKLKPLTNLYIDAADRLWVTTVTRDDYRNASVFYWPTAAW
jgi:hypothetical protein